MVSALLSGLLDVLRALKSIPRTGWVQRGVPPAVAEVIASHSYEASVICLEIGHRLSRIGVIAGDDVSRAALIALIHDVGEGVMGDLNRYTSRELGRVKQEIEMRAVDHIGSEIISELYREYIDRNTRASKLAHMCDKLSTYIQARRYRRSGYGVDEIVESSIEDVRRAVWDICGERGECLEEMRSIIEEIEKL